MSNNFNLHFISKQQAFDIVFNEKTNASKNTVLVNGRNYELHGDPFKIAWLKAKIPELTNSKGIALKELQISLETVGANDVTISKTHSVGMETLSSEVSEKIDKSQAMHQFLELFVQERGFSGVVLVVDRGTTILNSSYGKDSEPISSKTRFPIGSVTKPITSLAVLKLVNDGFFQGIKEPAQIKILDFLPESFHPEGDVKESWADITLLDLMNHTSGLPSFSDKKEDILCAKITKTHSFLSPDDVLMLAKKKISETPLSEKETSALKEQYPFLSRDQIVNLAEVANTSLSPEEFMNLIRGEQLLNKGSYNYSNFGYNLLGKIIETVSDEPYESFINRFLQDEFGVLETGYCEDAVLNSHYAEAIDWDEEKRAVFPRNKAQLDPPIEAYSSGGLYSTIDDLQIVCDKLMKTAFNEKEGVAVTKDPSNEFDFRQQFICTNGWNISLDNWLDSSGKPIQEIWKAGAVGGYGALMVFYPNQKSSIIVLSNQPRDIEIVTSDLTHMLCAETSPKEDELSHWEGLYRISAWDATYSISVSKQDSQYVFRETHPIKHASPIDISSNPEQVIFPWGPFKALHSIKKIDNQLFLCDPDGSPISGAVVDKIM